MHFKVAKDLVKNDPETLIYLNNAIALQGVQEKHLTIAVSVPIAINRQVAQEILRGVAQAQDDWNKKWKECANNGNEKYKDCKIQKPLQVIIASDDNDNEIAKNIARYLVDEDRKENVLAVIGHNASNVSNAVLDIYQSKKLVMISPTRFAMNHHRISNSLIDNKNYIYTMSPPIKSLIRRIKDEIIKDSGKGGVRVLFCYDSRADDQKLIKKHFYEGNDEIKLKIFPEAHAVGNDKDVYKENIDECNYNNPINHQNLIEYAKEKEIKYIFVAPHVNTISDSIFLIKDFSDLKLKLYSSPTLYTGDTLFSGKPDIEGLKLAVFWHPKADQKSMDFHKKAEKLWGKDDNTIITWRTAFAYDATQKILHGVEAIFAERIELNRANLQVKIAAEIPFQGITGSIEFDPKNGERKGEPNTYITKVCKNKQTKDYELPSNCN